MPILVKKQSSSNFISLNINDWNTRDFVSYYIKKYKELSNDDNFKFSPEVFLMYGARIKRFREKLKIKSKEYKDFIDWVFSDFRKFSNIAFSVIVNEKVWYYYKRSKNVGNSHVVRPITEEELKKMLNNIKNIYMEEL